MQGQGLILPCPFTCIPPKGHFFLTNGERSLLVFSAKHMIYNYTLTISSPAKKQLVHPDNWELRILSLTIFLIKYILPGISIRWHSFCLTEKAVCTKMTSEVQLNVQLVYDTRIDRELSFRTLSRKITFPATHLYSQILQLLLVEIVKFVVSARTSSGGTVLERNTNYFSLTKQQPLQFYLFSIYTNPLHITD